MRPLVYPNSDWISSVSLPADAFRFGRGGQAGPGVDLPVVGGVARPTVIQP
jgi:hypothetical protein